MARLSFDITNSTQLLSKLIDDYKDFEADRLSSRRAINCAMTAWHMSDWIYFEHNYDKQYKLFDFQERLKQFCPSLQIMQDITHGSKHFVLKQHQPKVDQAKLHEGEFSQEFSREFNISILVVEMRDGTRRYFEDDLKLAIDFWKDLISGNKKFGL